MLSIYINNTLLLHLIEKRHRDDLYTFYVESQHAIKKWIPSVDDIVNNKPLVDKLINQWLDLFISGNGLYLAIQHKNKMVGIASLDIDASNHSGSLGVWLHPNYMRKKIGVIAALKLLDIGFNEYNLNRIGANTSTDNHRVSSILEKLKFRKEGLQYAGYYINNTPQDVFLYGMLKADWENNREELAELSLSLTE